MGFSGFPLIHYKRRRKLQRRLPKIAPVVVLRLLMLTAAGLFFYVFL